MELLYLYYLAVFYLGAILGSFLNVVTLDIQKLFRENKLEERNELGFLARHIRKKYFWKSLMTRRSHCDSCGNTLKSFELFPIFSYLWQRGSCRSCGAKIDSSHLWVEIFSGFYFLGIFYVLFWNAAGFSAWYIWLVAYWFVFFGLLFVLALFDYRTQVIPDVLLLAVFVMAVGRLFTLDAEQVGWMIGASLIFASLFYLVWFVSRGRWIGFADGKLAGLIGLVFGFSLGWTALAVAFWAGAVGCIVLLLVGKLWKSDANLSLGSAVPFGPCLVFGMWFVFVSGINLFQII